MYFNMTIQYLIPLLLAIIAYWLKRFIERSDKRFDYFSEKIDELTKVLTTTYEDVKNQNANCSIKHIEIAKSIDKHTIKLEEHEHRITKLEK